MRRAGFSLLEVLLAGSLLLILLTLFARVLVPLFNSYRRSDRRTVLQQRLTVAMERTIAELQECNVRGITYVRDPLPTVGAGLAVQPLGEPAVDGRPLWSAELRVFVWDRKRLLFFRWTGRPIQQSRSDYPFAVPAAAYASVFDPATPEATLLVSEGVEEFRVSNLEPSVRQLPVKLEMRLTLPTGESLGLSQNVLLRNLRSR